MPILEREIDIYPEDLLDDDILGAEADRGWWALYTMARREKELMRRLAARRIPFYGPIIERRRRIDGRLRVSHIPLFAGYVFIYGDSEQRIDALTTNCISRCISVVDGRQVTAELRQFQTLIRAGIPLTPEDRLTPGQRVRIRRGRLAGIEGTILRREGQLRLLVAVNFLQRGASILIDDSDVEAI